MRPAKQVKVIASQLEVFQDMQTQLQNLLSYISDIIQKGVSWIEGLRNESYVEINQYLASETSECIKRCSAIPDSDEALLHDSASNENASKEYTLKSFSNLPETKDYVLLTEKMEILEKTISSYSKKMKVMQQKFLDNEEEINIKICRQVGETENKYDLKLQEIMKELHSASDFMLHLQGQNEILSGQVNKNEKQMIDILTSVESVQEKLSQIEQQSASGCNQNVSEENVRSSEADEMSAINTKLKALSSHYEMLSNKIMEHSQELQNISAANRVMQDLERDIKLFEEKYNQSNEEMKLKLQTADKKNVGHQSASEALTTTVEEFRKTLNKTTEMLNCLKKDHLELSLQLSALKSSTDKSINKQGNKTIILENKMASLDSKSLNVSSQVDKLSKEIVELRNKTPPEAFCAQLDEGLKRRNLKKTEIVTFFKRVVCGTGLFAANYDTSTGIYTAPYDGVYLVGLMLETLNDANIVFNVYRKIPAATEELQFFCSSSIQNKFACAVAPVYLVKGNQLYVKPQENFSNVQFDMNSFFMCVLVNTL